MLWWVGNKVDFICLLLAPLHFLESVSQFIVSSPPRYTCPILSQSLAFGISLCFCAALFWKAAKCCRGCSMAAPVPTSKASKAAGTSEPPPCDSIGVLRARSPSSDSKVGSDSWLMDGFYRVICQSHQSLPHKNNLRVHHRKLCVAWWALSL